MNSQGGEEAAWRSLEAFRRKIDRIDDGIVSLLSRRMAAAEEIGRLKRKHGLGVTDLEREKQILERLVSRRAQELDPGEIRKIFSGIIAACRSIQEPCSIAFLGPEGTFTHQAAIHLYGKKAACRPFTLLEEVFEHVSASQCDFGIVPLENSYAGPVGETLDCFSQYDLFIQAEVRLSIRHHLLTRSRTLEEVRCLYSHPMALAQCRRWIRARLPSVRITEVESTAGAAFMASRDPSAAAVGSRLAGELYEVPVLEKGIADRRDNITRFAAVGRSPADRGPSGRDRTSLLLVLEHRPAALFHALACLAQRGVNLTRIDSRPLRSAKWEYLFFLDLEGHALEDPLAMALTGLKERCLNMKLLGSYPREEDP